VGANGAAHMASQEQPMHRACMEPIDHTLEILGCVIQGFLLLYFLLWVWIL
jgi:hypothetical protein